MTTGTPQDRTVDLGDIRVAFGVAGAGPSRVVLVHGLAESRETWAAQQQSLGEVETFAYDLRGHGQTTLGAADGTLAQLAQDLVRFLETVTGPAVCVGFSLGGTVVLAAAERRPDLVRQAVVLGTSSVVGRAAVAFYDSRIASAEAADQPAIARALRDDTQAGIARAHDQVDEVTARRVAAVGDLGGYLNGVRAMRALHAEPLTPLLAHITVPVEVVGAHEDTFCPRKAADILIDHLPDARYTELPNAGHLMNVDAPAAVTAVLRSALNLEV